MQRLGKVLVGKTVLTRSLSTVNVPVQSEQASQMGMKIAAAVAVAAVGATIVSQQSIEDIVFEPAHCAGKSDPPHEHHSVTEIAMLLREKLKSPRDKLKNQNKPVPVLTVRMIPLQNRNNREVTETQVIDTSFDPSCNVLGLLNNWLKVFDDKSVEKTASKIRTFKEFYSNPNKITLPFISEDKKKSMTITKFSSGEGNKVSVTLFNDSGYSVTDIENIVKGYEEGFCSNAVNPSDKIEFQMTDDHHLQDRVFTNLDDYQRKQPFSGKFFVDYSDKSNPSIFEDMENHSEGTSRKKKGASSNPIEELRGLGVEVFDQSNNQKLGWDFLAGYDYVKEDIQDTVLNAIKYPEVYEQIARKTRVHYESNRPKAVLLEGPPGTGKTLTARILASQCEIPLIVLKLETIVSKWYGDAEKKLAQILDACDQLGNSIIFIDEIDSLAQSRENENGIHEVSKRILSVLLQKLEGFHGKSNSILICATNRKEDLDAALLSRFDLMIKYNLPDFETRQEIFRRYAKHLNQKNSYDTLANISSGLSCRDLKEACEQAERICASRVVHQRYGGKITKNGSNGTSRKIIVSDAVDLDLPTLDDYIQCIQIKMNDQRGGSKSSAQI